MKSLIIFATVLHLGWLQEVREPFRMPNRCTEMAPDQGTGTEYLEKWYYNPADGMCKEFMYSGRGGNANRFDSREACEQECQGMGPMQTEQESAPVADETKQTNTEITTEAKEVQTGQTSGTKGIEPLAPEQSESNREAPADDISTDEQTGDTDDDDGFTDGHEDDEIIAKNLDTHGEMNAEDGQTLREVMAAYGAEIIKVVNEEKAEETSGDDQVAGNQEMHADDTPAVASDETQTEDQGDVQNRDSDDDGYPDGEKEDAMIREYIKTPMDGSDEEMLKEAIAAYGADTLRPVEESEPKVNEGAGMEAAEQPVVQEAKEGDENEEDDEEFNNGEKDDYLIKRYTSIGDEMSAEDAEMLREAMAAYEVSAMKEVERSEWNEAQKELNEGSAYLTEARAAIQDVASMSHADHDGENLDDDDHDDDDDDEIPEGIDLAVDYPPLNGIADVDDQQALTDAMNAFDVVEAVTDGREVTGEVLAHLPMIHDQHEDDHNKETLDHTASEESGFVDTEEEEEGQMDPVDEIMEQEYGAIFNPDFHRGRQDRRRGQNRKERGESKPTQGPTKEITFMLPMKDQPPNSASFMDMPPRPAPRSPIVRQEISAFTKINRDFIHNGPPNSKPVLKPSDIIPPFSPLRFLLLRALSKPGAVPNRDNQPTPPPMGLPFNPHVRIIMPPTLSAQLPIMPPLPPMSQPMQQRASDDWRERKNRRKNEREFGRRRNDDHEFDRRHPGEDDYKHGRGRMFGPNMKKFSDSFDASREDNRHVNNVTPNNKFTLLQVFVNKQHKKDDKSMRDFKPVHDRQLQKSHTPPQHDMQNFNRPPIPFIHPNPHPVYQQYPQHPQMMPRFPQEFNPHYHQSQSVGRQQSPFMSNPFPMRPFHQPIPQGHIHQHRPEPDMRRPDPEIRRPMIILHEDEESEEYDEEVSADVCLAPLAPGHCKSYETKWYYNRETNKCEIFYYTGCGGNGNKFETWEECAAVCVDMPEGPHITDHTTTDLEPDDEEDERPDTIIFTSTVMPSTDQEAEQAVRDAQLETESAISDAKVETVDEVAVGQDFETKEEEAGITELEQNEADDASHVGVVKQDHVSREYIILLAVMATVALAVVVLITIAVVHLCRKTKNNKKEKVLEAVINQQLYGDHANKNVYTTKPVSDIPAKA